MPTLTELMMKVVDGQPLPPLDRESLRQMLEEMDTIRNTFSVNPRFETVRARRLELDTPPGNPYMVYWFDADVGDMFSIPNSTWTALDLTDSRLIIKQDSPCVIRLDGTKIYPFASPCYIAFQGRVLFNTNATGTRHVAISFYDSTDTLIERRMLSAEASIGAGSGTPVPISNFRPLPSPLSTDPKQYFQIEVWQDSGGALGVCGIDLMFSFMFR